MTPGAALEALAALKAFVTAVARFATHEMTALGFDAHVDEVGNAVGSIGSGPVTVALVGHIDTVDSNLYTPLHGIRPIPH